MRNALLGQALALLVTMAVCAGALWAMIRLERWKLAMIENAKRFRGFQRARIYIVHTRKRRKTP